MRQVVRCAVLVVTALTFAPAGAETDQAAFYRAYYLEHAEHRHAEAEEIYAEIARSADGALRTAARARRDSMREERLGSDLARLMPPNALAYVELNQPGNQAERLLRQLGLLADEGQQRDAGELAISPALVRAVAGLKGIAGAITGIDPANETVAGVLVLHPGDLELVRGLLETALPVAADPVDEIDGYTTYNIEGEVFVTLTHRLVIVSPQQHEIAGVIERLGDADAESLANSPHMQPLLARRQGGLVYFAVNFEPVMPLLEAAMAGGAAASEEIAVINALLDPRSLRSLTGEAGVADDGLFLDVTLELADSHRNLVFNFLQLPPLDATTLERIPRGAAGFFAAALNPRTVGSPLPPDSDAPLPISGMDIGREIFGNIVGLAAFVLPPGPGPQATIDGEPIPDAAVIITVNDPARSQALWTTVLGLASMAANDGRADSGAVTIDGVRAYRYNLDELDLYLATTGTDLIVSPSRYAIGRALATRDGRDSLAGDPGFAAVLDQIGSDTTIAAGLHPGRCLEVAEPFMSDHDMEEVAPVRAMLTDTVAGLAVTHGRDTFRLVARVTGLPDVGGLVSQLIAEERGHRHRATPRRSYRSDRRERPERPERIAAPRERGEPDPWSALTRAARAGADAEDLKRLAGRLADEMDDANELNNRAWALLTEDYGAAAVSAAWVLARRSNELSGYDNWAYLDTLALAEYRSGNLEEAVTLQRKALERADSDRSRRTVRESLKKFEQALRKEERARN